MNYPNGKKVLLGDKVKLWEGCFGTVVCSMDDDEYDTAFSKADWSYLKSGTLINSDKGGLIHFIKPEQTLELIERKKGKQ